LETFSKLLFFFLAKYHSCFIDSLNAFNGTSDAFNGTSDAFNKLSDELDGYEIFAVGFDKIS